MPSLYFLKRNAFREGLPKRLRKDNFGLILSELSIPTVEVVDADTRISVRSIPTGRPILNWGVSSKYLKDIPESRLRLPTYLNSPFAVTKAVNKKVALDIFSRTGIPTLEATDNWNVAAEWLEADGFPLFHRSLLESSGGKGINIIKTMEELHTVPNGAFFTRGFKKTHELRVHVFNTQVIDTTVKKLMSAEKMAENGINPETRSKFIRSWDNGWVFSHDLSVIPNLYLNAMKNSAINAVAAIGLDFGAVDIAFNAASGRYKVLEVNSAPGIECTETKEAYKQAIQNYINLIF